MVDHRRIRIKRIIFIIAIILLVLSIYLKFFYFENCYQDRKCFNVALARCDKAIFKNYGLDSAWYYKIEGKQGDSCIVYVENINFKTAIEAVKLKDKSMECYLPFGLITSPESNIDLCHGLLKEELQDLIIEKMHLYIVQNIGNITEAIEKIV